VRIEKGRLDNQPVIPLKCRRCSETPTYSDTDANHHGHSNANIDSDSYSNDSANADADCDRYGNTHSDADLYTSSGTIAACVEFSVLATSF
jgi:hypothetical protein